MAFALTMLWKQLSIITLDDYPNRNSPTDSADQANLLADGEHIALLGPRHGGKALVLAELQRRANLGDHPPTILRLMWDEFPHDKEAAFLNALSGELGVERPVSTGPGRLASVLTDLFLQGARSAGSPLWVFVQDVLGFPNLIARELLMAFQACRAREDLRRRFAVVVTGGNDLRHLTYGYNSPYRHARQILMTGLDEVSALAFFCRRRQRQKGLPGLDQGLAPVSAEEANQEITSKAFQYLYKQTGGQAHLLQELVLTTARHPYTLSSVELARCWDLPQCEQCVETFLRVHLGNDYFTRLAMTDIERDPAVFDTLLQILDNGDGYVEMPGDMPDPLELNGVVRRDAFRKAFISCDIWRTFLKKYHSPLHRADVFALQGGWKRAWTAYGDPDAPPLRYSRPIAGVDAENLQVVLSRWASSLLDYIPLGTEAVCSQFFQGAHFLLGFTGGGLYEQTSGKPIYQGQQLSWLQSRATAGAFAGKGEYHNFKTENNVSYGLDDSRGFLRSIPVFPMPWPRNAKPVLYLERSAPGEEIDSDEQRSLPHLLGRFWHAYRTACRIEEENSLGAIRARLEKVVEDLRGLLVKDPFDMGEVVHETARLLVQKGEYLRVQIALVDGKQERIQAVASAFLPGEKDFSFDSDFPLVPLAAHAEVTQRVVGTTSSPAKPPPEAPRWDIQQKVVIEKKLCCVVNASDPTQSNPTTQPGCSDMGMRGISVVPIRFGDKVLGTIHFELLAKDVPSEAEQDLFQGLADRIGFVFHQAQRLTLLQESLNMFHSKVVILDPSRRVVFLNKSAWLEDYSTKCSAPGWLPQPFDYEAKAVFKDAAGAKDYVLNTIWPRLEILRRTFEVQDPHMSRYLFPGDVVEGIQYPGQVSCEWILGAIDDFRSNLSGPFHACSRIGYVEKIYELSDLYRLLEALRTWLSEKSVQSVARAVLGYLREGRFAWGRIYLCRRLASGHRQLCSFDEFGLSASQRADFLAQKITMPEGDPGDPLAWHVLQQKREAIYVYKPENSGNVRPADRRVTPTDPVQGLTAFAVNYRDSRDVEKLGKSDARWIEAPLIVGNEVIGKLSVSMPSDDTALLEKWELFRHAVLGASTAMGAAQRAEREAQTNVEQAWKETSEMAVHQLANKIPPALSFLSYALQSLSAQPKKAAEYISDAMQSLHRATEIINDFRRYASEQAFADYEILAVAELLKRVRVRAQSLAPPATLDIHCEEALAEVLIETSVQALSEVFEILVRNSVMHSGRSPTGLSLVVEARRAHAANASVSPLLLLEYRDNGRGILSNMRAGLFSPFNTDHPEGTGLGLAIAKRFLKRLGGDIAETGREHEGVRFIIQIPLQKNLSLTQNP